MGRFVPLWPLLLAGALALAAADPAAAKETITDDAGEVLYVIDDNGTVSMFENSPGTDVTLSVTRGTREQMRPRVTEVLPATVPAGAFAVLKLTGQNLVGAKVKLSAPEIAVQATPGKPKRLDVPITVPLTMPPGPVTIEVTTPIGATTAVFRVVEVQIGAGEGAKHEDVVKHSGQGYGGDEGVLALPTTAPKACPAGMVGVASEGGGFCIETDRTFTGDFRKAEQFCALSGKRLCMQSEWQTACRQAQSGRVPLRNMRGEWEWTGGFDILQDDTQQDTRYFVLGKNDCDTERGTMRLNAESFTGRCCRNP